MLENVTVLIGPFLDLLDAFYGIISLLGVHYLGARLFITDK